MLKSHTFILLIRNPPMKKILSREGMLWGDEGSGRIFFIISKSFSLSHSVGFRISRGFSKLSHAHSWKAANSPNELKMSNQICIGFRCCCVYIIRMKWESKNFIKAAEKNEWKSKKRTRVRHPQQPFFHLACDTQAYSLRQSFNVVMSMSLRHFIDV